MGGGGGRSSASAAREREIGRQKTAMGGGAGRSSASAAIFLHILSGMSLVSAYFLVCRYVYGLDLVTYPAQTLRLLLIVQAPIVIGSYSWVRRHPQRCSFLKAATRGLLGLPLGALINAFGAMVMGAPVGIKYLVQTIYWSFLMSLFTVVPAACVFGSSRMDWQHFLACSKPTDIVEYMIFLPAYGAVIGAWFGAWPMPLDWERPWQEWPICVTYGAVAGYLLALLASSVCILLLGRRLIRAKAD